MDRNSIFRNESLGALCVMVMLLVAAQSFGAVTNGSFDTSLLGWQTSDNSGVVWSSEGLSGLGGAARLQESSDFSDSILFQQFDVESGSERLNFSVRTTPYGTGETDYLWIDIFDENNTLNSLFTWNSDAGEYILPDYVDYVTLSELTDGTVTTGWLYDFSIPVNFGDSMTLQFKLKHGHETPEEISTIVLVDNAALQGSSTPPVVPVPSAIGLALSGLAAIGVFARKLN